MYNRPVKGFLYQTKSQTGTKTFEESEISEPRYPLILLDNSFKIDLCECVGGAKPNPA